MGPRRKSDWRRITVKTKQLMPGDILAGDVIEDLRYLTDGTYLQVLFENGMHRNIPRIQDVEILRDISPEPEHFEEHE